MTEGHSTWYVRRDRAARKAAKLLENYTECQRRCRSARRYDAAEYDKPTAGDDLD